MGGCIIMGCGANWGCMGGCIIMGCIGDICMGGCIIMGWGGTIMGCCGG